ncbi:MAG: hypothetical protein ACI4J5_02640 [Oscillospiraceae bacterium]
MNITREQFISALEQKKKRIRKFNRRSKLMIVSFFFCLGISVIFIFISIALNSSALFCNLILFIGITFLIIGAELYIINRRMTNTVCIEENHYPPSVNILRLEDVLSDEYYSNYFMSQAEKMLSAEKDILIKGHIRDQLVSGYLFRGESETAAQNNILDKELFRKDRYYELIYLNELMQYDLSFDPPRSIEDNYRRFTELFESDKVNKNDPAVLLAALICEMDHACAQNEPQKVLDSLDIISAAYGAPEKINKSGVKTEYAALMITRADALYQLGKCDEAQALALEWSEYLRLFPYQYGKAQRLLQKFSQDHTEVQ